MDLETFFKTVITTKEGNLVLGYRDNSGWFNEWFKFPEELDKCLEFIEEKKPNFDLYFSSYLFSDTRKIKSCVLQSKTIQADLDAANLLDVPVQPTFVVQTSPGRSQAYWILQEFNELEIHETLSRKLTYAIQDSEHSGWSLGHMMRIPTSLNFKYLEGPHEVKIIEYTGKTYPASDLELLPDKPIASAEQDLDWLKATHIKPALKPNQLLESIKNKGITSKVYAQYNTRVQDRSAALWSLMQGAFRAGLSKDEVLYLAENSANNKFKDLKYHSDLELAKDVLRAEKEFSSKSTNSRQEISAARKLPFPIAIERHQHIAALIKKRMQESGEFFHCYDDTLWYVRKDVGRPVQLARRSDHLDSLLDLSFGINATEPIASYITSSLLAQGLAGPVNSKVAMLSYYDKDSNTILLHTGKKDILAITANAITTIINGGYGVIFPWNNSNESFHVDFTELPEPWHEILFGMSLNNLVDLDKNLAMTLLRVWTIFVLMRNASVSRPILSLFGSPGSGKSTLFRRIYILLYGKNRSVSSITSSEAYDHSVSINPLVVLDNVDTWEKWLPDRLALSASTSDIEKRKLWTDVDNVTMRRQAMIGITAHNPKFGREDVADRMIILTFERLQHFIPEGELIEKIVSLRNRIWGGIVKDLQKVLAIPQGYEENAPQFRIEDFAKIGYRIAKGLGIQDDFTSAIKIISKKQKDFSLDEESMLVDVLQTVVQNQNDVWRSSGQLWSVLVSSALNPKEFERRYRNPIALGKKLWVMTESLKENFDVNYRTSTKTGQREWQFRAK